MKMRTSELTGTALDWAVATCEGKGVEFDDLKDPWLTLDGIAYQPLHSYTPSTDWAQGGPIVEREGIGIWSSESGEHDGEWCARTISTYITYSPTPLIAAMRCYVASELGDEIELPDELLQGE
jgi:hypothetical protein